MTIGLPWSEVLTLLPELCLLAAVCVALVAPVLPPLRATLRASHGPLTALAAAALIAAVLSAIAILAGWGGLSVPESTVLHGMLAVDPFALSVKIIICLFTLLVIVLWSNTTRGSVRLADGPDYVSLVLSGALGMCLMASATNFLMVFLAIEAASFPSYALAGFNKQTRRSSEASLKYVLIGAAASALMLYGLSMLYGYYGTLDLVPIAERLAAEGMSAGLLMGVFGLLIGIGFKLSAVPIHFWCPDVFEGASIEITTFLSVASKAGAIALLVRIMMTLGHFSAGEEASRVLVGIGSFVGLVGVVTATWGNLAAYFQTNVKRLLAYSSIAHAGYMIMLAGLLTAAMDRAQPTAVAYALLFYLIVYAFMNLGAFAVAAVVAKETGSESLDEFAGLGQRNAFLAVAMGCFLLSLFGMPLTGGFWGKVRFGFEMWDEGMWWLVVALIVNTVFSLYFYLKPIIIMVWKQPESSRALTMAPAMYAVVLIALLGVFATGLAPDRATAWAQRHSTMVFTMPVVEAEAQAGLDEVQSSAAATGIVSEAGR
ncbi:MAG: NADH-quinone oxidoreductase subunit N [Phycisphaerales bacterium]|nr:NADH-quinone oxidoreductase subunit N [Phycisphaerales bacterium]